MGSLVYPGYRGKHVVINSIFYSPDATGALILPGALFNAGALLDLTGNDILISTCSEGPVLRASYSASGRKWELPVTGALGQKYKSGLSLSNQGTHLEDSKE
ncbi:hypothetical protein O181_113836 [Austropuccinia psidii MF-1]|uniref:Uncharacterized protein n=1 Tax=Austropuccinia psidii MF-1 TaxID=1389203 RepID=A0A9Q3K5R3_9BASI|nr:hypothetical protein [Austropuccinia psidii MF-1]